MTVPDARRLRELESENERLKKLLAEAHLDIEALKLVARGKNPKPDGTTGGGGKDARAHPHLRAPRLRVDRAVQIGAALHATRVVVNRRSPWASRT